MEKVWNKTENCGCPQTLRVWEWRCTEGTRVDLHGNPIIQKYATESDVVTVTAGSKRTRSYPGTESVQYAKKALQVQHNFH